MYLATFTNLIVHDIRIFNCKSLFRKESLNAIFDFISMGTFDFINLSEKLCKAPFINVISPGCCKKS